ncbi:hypothetical protein F7725_006863 [Dissostichus mawsoni]|uniref:Uncharacterized protein n=1 Tax=Dissostichus mawsoni TaxID=36200 RepID=A0A7J5XVR7_DISMA|nr:hypothetical protein F7725_006863 [Dissostichus mawsoni]
MTVAYRDTEAVSDAKRLSWMLVSPRYLSSAAEMQKTKERDGASSLSSQHWCSRRFSCSVNESCCSQNNLLITFWLYVQCGPAAIHNNAARYEERSAPRTGAAWGGGAPWK